MMALAGGLLPPSSRLDLVVPDVLVEARHATLNLRVPLDRDAAAFCFLDQPLDRLRI